MPTIKLTKSKVDELPPVERGQVFYWDATLKGFGLRVTPTSKTYIAEGRVNGKTCRVKIGAHGPFAPENARSQAVQLLAEMSKGNNPNTEKQINRAKAITLAEVFADYKVSRKLRPKTIVTYDDVMRRCFPDWQNKPITSITKDMVEQRHRELSNRNGPRGKGEAHANRAMRALQAILNYASLKYEDRRGQPIIAVNPVRRLSEIRAWNEIPRRQTLVQVHQLKAWARAVCGLPNEAIRDYLLVLVLTGLKTKRGGWSEMVRD